MSDHEDLRAALEKELLDVLSKSSRITDHLRNVDRSVPKDWSEMAQFLENDEVLEALEARSRDRIIQLQTALARIEEGVYATCALCGKDISTPRLELLPTTTTCAACAP